MPETETYIAPKKCWNCGYLVGVGIPRGTPIKTFMHETGFTCPDCGVENRDG